MNCRQCWKNFTPRRPTYERYCSKECRVKANCKRSNARRKASREELWAKWREKLLEDAKKDVSVG